jgi:hypothetical protein
MTLDSLERLIGRLVSRKGFAGRKHKLLFSKDFKIWFYRPASNLTSEAKRCFLRSLSCWSRKTLESNMSAHINPKEKQIMAILIDDFSTGTDSFNVTTGSDNRTQTGNKIIGGQRRTILIVPENPLLQSAHLDVGSGSLNLSTGVNQPHRLEVYYGKAADPNSQMSLDLSGFDRFRFLFLSSNLPLNFNLQVLSGTNLSTAGPKGVNLEASFNPFTHDFLLEEFAGNANFSAIDTIAVICQSGIAGQDYAIDSIEVTGILEELRYSRP